MDKISRNGHGNIRRNWRSASHRIPEAFVERLYIAARTDRAQIHRDAASANGKFFSRVHELSAETFALLRRIDAEQSQIHPVPAQFQIDATDKPAALFEQQKLTSIEVIQSADVVDAIAADERTLDFKCRVDEPRKPIGVRVLCNANRNCDSWQTSGKNGAAWKLCRGAELFFDAKQLIVFCNSVCA